MEELKKLIDSKMIDKPGSKAYMKYHFKKGMELLKALYKGDNSFNAHKKLSEYINVVSKEHGLDKELVSEVEVYEGYKLLERYPPIIEVNFNRDEFPSNSIRDNISKIKKELGNKDNYIWLVNRINGSPSIKIHSVTINEDVTAHHELLSKAFHQHIFKGNA